MRSIHEIIRMARRLHAAYEQRAAQSHRQRQTDWCHLEQRFQQARDQRHLIDRARSRGWNLAVDQLKRHHVAAMRSLHDYVRHVYEEIFEPSMFIPGLMDLVTELQFLDREFDEVVFNRKSFVAISTEPITLEGIELGRFSMRLHWPRLAYRADIECFEVVALQPNPARGHFEVSHPHVKSRILCAGDATTALQKALEEGRLTDAFHLIQSVLGTYNSQSAYASLSEWEGATCWNCSCFADEEDRCSCAVCEHDVCSDCTSFCKQCDGLRCASCQTRCEVCNQSCCSVCLTTSAVSELSCCKECLCICDVCGEEVASSEIDEETQRCTTCQEAAVETAQAENDQATPIPKS